MKSTLVLAVSLRAATKDILGPRLRYGGGSRRIGADLAAAAADQAFVG